MKSMSPLAALNRVSDNQSARDSEWQLGPRFPFKKWLAGFVALGCTVVLLVAALSERQAADLAKSRDWVVHTYQVLTELDTLLTLVTDAETGQRGYIITGRKEYLKPYQDAETALPRHLAQIKELTQDNVAQQKRIPVLQAALEQKLQELQQTIDLRSHGQLTAATKIVASDRAKRHMDSVRSIISSMKAEEQRLLLSRTELVRQNLDRFHLYLDILVGSIAAAISWFLFLLFRHWQRSSALQQSQIAAASIEQEERFQLLFDLMPELSWTARPDGFIDFYNKQWYDYTGTTQEQMQGWGWQSVHDPARLPEVMERWRYSLETGTPFEMEFPLRRADGVFRRFLTRVKPMLDKNGKIVRWVGINTDIDERAAELETINARLKESEQRLDLALHSGEVGAWDLDLRSGTAWHSLKHDQIFGYEHQQPMWTLDIFMSHVVPEDRSRVKQEFERAYITGNLSLECRITRDHSIAWILAQGKVFRDNNGEPIRVMGTVMDITERKEAEQAKERLAAIVATSNEAIIGKTLDGVITNWNNGAEQIYGYQETEVIGKPISILIPPNAVDELPTTLSRIARGEFIKGYETSRMTKDGRLIDVYLTISPVTDREGNIIAASTVARDITEVKRAQTALREAKDFSDALFQSAPDAILLVDSQGLIFSLNSQAEKLLGYSGAELLGQTVEFLMPARFREHHIGHRQLYSHNPQKRAMGAGLDLNAQRKDGSEFPVDIMLSPVKTGKTSLTMAVIRDLTEQRKLEAERKKAEQVLREQDASLRNPLPDPSLVRMAKITSTFLAVAAFAIGLIVLIGCIFQIDVLRNPTTWGTYTKANGALCLLLAGVSLLIAREPRLVPRFIPLVLASVIVAIAGITLCEWVLGWNAGIDQLIAPDRLIRENFAPGRMPASPAIAWLIAGIGLWALSRRRIILSQICALGTFAVGLLTLTGHTYGFAPLLSFGSSTLVSLPMSIGLILAGAALWLLHVDAGIAHVLVSPSLGGKLIRRLFPLLFLVPAVGLISGMERSTTADMLVLTSVTTLLFPAIVWLAGRTIDHLDRQKDQALERAFARREELEESNRQLAQSRDEALQASNFKSAFVANISHELRTPLSGIIGATDLLVQQNLKPEDRELLTSTQESAQSLKALVDDLLDLSRVESGKFAIEQASFRPADVIKDSITLCARAAENKSLALTASVDPRVPALVTGDAGRIKQVLLNLINNGIKFTSSGDVRLDVVPESERDGQIFVTFSVADTGIGISEEDQKLLFIPFSQVDSSATRQYGGAGLGLALCKNLIELMGGKIGVKSRKGEGSVFWFTVPLRLSPVSKAEAKAAEPVKSFSKLDHKIVLVVEDNPVIQKLVVKQLLSLGLQANAASNGKDALDAVQTTCYDLILMDCNLPDITGFDVTKEIHKAETDGKPHVPIVAMTAAAMAGDRERCLASGMDDYLSKPVRIQQLQQMLEKWLVPRSEARLAPEEI
jgi:PAS domain S-box-containing protein